RVTKAGPDSSNGVVATAKSRGRARSRRSTEVSDWVNAWKVRNLPVNGHMLLHDRPNAEKGLFGLWAIRLVAGETGKVVTTTHLTSFLYEVFEIKVDPRNIGRALERSDIREKVLHVEGTRYQILPPGIAWAQE